MTSTRSMPPANSWTGGVGRWRAALSVHKRRALYCFTGLRGAVLGLIAGVTPQMALADTICATTSALVDGARNNFQGMRGSVSMMGLANASTINFPGAACNISTRGEIVTCVWLNMDKAQADAKIVSLSNELKQCKQFQVAKVGKGVISNNISDSTETVMVLTNGARIGLEYSRAKHSVVNTSLPYYVGIAVGLELDTPEVKFPNGPRK